MILEMNDSDSIVANYTFGPGIDDPIAMHRDYKNYYYLKDGLGSVRALTDSIGNTVKEYKYSVFGKITEESGDSNFWNPFTYTGREWEKELGIYFYRARYFDPELGRFLGEDPIGYKGRDLNFYRYVSNDPPNSVDPSGLKLMICTRPTKNEKLGATGAQHAYIWDTRTGKSAGQGVDPFRQENGPTGKNDCCRSIPNSEGKEDFAFAIAIRTMLNGWLPVTSDCHIWANYTLSLAGLKNPLSFGDRFNNPQKKCKKEDNCNETNKECPCETE